MLVQLVVVSLLLPYCLTVRNQSYGICQKINLCRKKIEPCYPIVTKCQNGSCRFRLFTSNDNQRSIVARWFYDSNLRQCRRATYQIESFVYFRFLRDCQRLCSTGSRNKTNKIISLRAAANTANDNNTIFVNLHIDLSSGWIQQLADLMNISTRLYNSQVDYFQNYRRRFMNFLDSGHQLMLDSQQNIKKKNY